MENVLANRIHDDLEAIDKIIKKQGRTISAFSVAAILTVVLAVIVSIIIITHINEAEAEAIEQIRESNDLIRQQGRVILGQDSTIREQQHIIEKQHIQLAQKDTIINLQERVIKDLRYDIKELKTQPGRAIQQTEGSEFNRRFDTDSIPPK